MSKPIRASLLVVTAILLAAPVLAKAAPALAGDDAAGRSAAVYAKADDVDCSKLDSDDARQKCREAKRKHNDDKDVDCSKLKDDDARKKCVEAKVKH